jgi:hypothetical protein
LVAVAFGEPGYEALVDRLSRDDQLFASNLLEAELLAAFHRERIAPDRSLLEGIGWILPDRPLTAEIETVLEAGTVRGAGLWHLACALFLSPNPHELEFLTLDRRQADVATAIGFRGSDLGS